MTARYVHGACAHIDPLAIAHNLRRLREYAGKGVGGTGPSFWAVVKADAYGHGLDHALPGVLAADGLAMTSVADAYRCRAQGWTKPILLMGDRLTAADLNDPVLYPLHLVVQDAWQLEQLERFSGASIPHVWLRFAGKLNHAGFTACDYPAAYARLHALFIAARVAGIGHLQHYARADDAKQLALERHAFTELTAGLAGHHCTENSAALLASPAIAAQTQWLRTGIALYGVSPFSGNCASAWGLKPAMSLQAPIFALQDVQAGEPIGYGGAFRSGRRLRIGLVRCGYADGYPRAVRDGCPVLVRGRKTRIVGRVSMDTLTIDLTELPEVRPGDHVTLWGSGALPVEEIALAAGTIAAQLLTGLTAQVARRSASGG
ncbi:alanine racemase [Candidimonas sp. SYP-B2681]|uniref:alanine racemase n=1 Tax=Candidimonas sp. SYP-B2681 TaxID=2497686 RepID=UPI000F864915|nr:alanine racemase [Candidimonas sp. SYP-B2681]RTZ39774.1 alanine racemase [Candidimonas sp. SYP-B2681]